MDFKNRIKKTITAYKGLSTLGLSHIISSGMNAVLWFIVAAISGPEGYGEIGFYIAIALISSVVATPGISNTLLVYSNKDEKINSSLFGFAMVLIIISSIIIIFIVNNFSTSLFFLGYSIFGLVTTDIISKKLFAQFLKITVIQRIFSIILAISLYHMIGIEGVIFGLAFSYLVFIPKFIVILKKHPIDLNILKKYKIFMLNNYGFDINSILTSQLDKILIFPLYGSLILGNYYLAFQVLTISSVLPGTVYQYLLTSETKEKSFKNLKLVTIIFPIILSIIVIILSPIIFPIFFPDYLQVVGLIQIMILAMIPQTINLMYIAKFMTTGNSRIALNGSILFIISQVLGIIILGEILDTLGLAIALILGNVVQFIYYSIKFKLSI